MDLTKLRDSLDSSSRERHPARVSAKRNEVKLSKDFKAAALHLTKLYRSSLSSSDRSYATGYAQSLTDILDTVNLRLQQPANSAPGFRQPDGVDAVTFSSSTDSDREELRWLARYLNARLEAIKAENEEAEKEESGDEEETGNVGTSADANTDRTLRHNAAQSRAMRTTRSRTGTREEPRAPMEMTSPETTMVDSARASPVTTIEANRPVRRTLRTPSQTPETIQRTTSLFGAEGTPPPMMQFGRASSSEVEEGHGRHATPTPSRRPASRLGKRLTGRDRLSGLDLFSRAQNAKRRRGLGDRRDEDDALI